MIYLSKVIFNLFRFLNVKKDLEYSNSSVFIIFLLFICKVQKIRKVRNCCYLESTDSIFIFFADLINLNYPIIRNNYC